MSLTGYAPQHYRDETPVTPDYLVQGLWVRGAITDFPAKVKAGKTTFIMAAIAATLQGQPFLNQETRPSNFLYLTEERGPTIRSALERAGLLDICEERLLIFPRSENLKLSWPEVILEACEIALKGNYTGLVIDTLSRWAKIEGELAEQSSGLAAVAMAPLEAAAALGLGIISVRHDNKGEGASDPSDAGRGSSAYAGASDIILNLRRANQNGHSNRRVIRCATRFGDLPDEIYGDLTDTGYQFVSEGFEGEEAKALALAALIAGPLTLNQLVEQTGCAKTTLFDALADVVRSGELITLPSTRGGPGRPQNLYSYPPR